MSVQTNVLKNTRNAEALAPQLSSGLSMVMNDCNQFTLVLLEHANEVRINFETQRVFGNCIFFLCPGEVLEIRDYTNMYVLDFPKDIPWKESVGFRSFFGDIRKAYPILDETFLAVYELSIQLKKVVTQRPIYWKEEGSILLEAIFEQTTIEIELPRAKNKNLFHNFQLLVHEHYTKCHQVAYYAQMLAIPAKQITQRFSELGVDSPHTYIKERLVTEAKRQLIFTNKTLKNICYDIGFNDPAYFARFFKKNVGIKGTEFRNREQNIF